jgi:hypothetical protein
MATLSNSLGSKAAVRTPQLAGIEPCNFPPSDLEEIGEDRIVSFEVQLEPREQLHALLCNDGDMLRSHLRTAWSIVLGCYTGLDDTCFGYQEGPLEGGIETQTGLKIARIELPADRTVKQVVTEESRTTLSSVPASDEPLFNTVMILKDGYKPVAGQAPNSQNAHSTEIIFEKVGRFAV